MNLKINSKNLFGADDTTVNNAITIAWGTNTVDAETNTYTPFPIPAHDRIYLHPHVTGAVKVWDMQGRDCSAMLRRDGQTLWIDGLPAGNYLLEAVVNGAAQRWRLVRE